MRIFAVSIWFIYVLFLPIASAVNGGIKQASDTLTRIQVRGVVSGFSNIPLSGVSIKEKNCPNGTISDKDGKFSLSVSSNAVLLFSFIGYETAEYKVEGQNYISISLKERYFLLDTIMVTALGIPKKSSSLSYSAEEVSGELLNKVKAPNMITALTGKIAGVRINQSSSGVNGSAKVNIRGIRSVAGDNQPLYVLDGVPILNTYSEQPYSAIGGISNAGNRDGGDGISNLNPENIEKITVLKGASASALYGSHAANGVILITTKKGDAGALKVTFSTNLLFDRAFSLPQMQNSYGVSDNVDSWGSRRQMQKNDNLNEFFRSGVNSITFLGFMFGNQKIQNVISYANTAGHGIIENNRLRKHNLHFKQSSSVLEGRLDVEASVNLIRSTEIDKPVPGGFYMNPLVGLYRFPRGEKLSYYKDNFEIYDVDRKLYGQNWHASIEDFEQNPYWITNRISSEDQRMRIMPSIALSLKLLSWLKLQARGNVDYVSDKFRQKFYATTAPALCGVNGRYIESDFQEMLVYGDVMAMIDRTFSSFSVNAVIGASINDKTLNSIRYDSKNASLRYPNVFTLANIVMDGSASLDQQIDARRQLQSLFGTFTLGYREAFYFDFSVRNDWSSTLAFTSHEKTGFFYPSLGTSWIMSRTFKMPTWISFAKIRASYSKVGNDIPLFITNPVSHIGAGGEIQISDVAPFKEMEPEITNSVDIGMEWRFFMNRFGVNFSFYKTNTLNQFFKLPALSGDQYAYRYVNAGDIQNLGVELSLSGTPVITPDLQWKTTINISHNKNKVKRLHDELSEFVYGPTSFSSTYAMKLVKGGAIGDIYGKAFLRDGQGNIIFETEGYNKGLPCVTGDGNTEKVGNANPLFLLGWNNTLNYKNIDLSFLIDCRYGGEILSQTQADMDMYGVSKETAKARDRGYVMLEGRKIENVKGFYKNVVGGRAGVTEYYMYDATNIRLRELSVGYSLPSKWIEKIRCLRNVRLAFTARNLFFIYKKAPFDPDLILSTGNDNQGIEVFGMPTIRSLGFNIKCEL